MKKEFIKLLADAEKLYESKGMGAVIEKYSKDKRTAMQNCIPCATSVPTVENICLVCGTHTHRDFLHTKGPWLRHNAEVSIPVYNDKAGAEVHRFVLRTHNKEAIANAALIAASPDMVAALVVGRETARHALQLAADGHEVDYKNIIGHISEVLDSAIQKTRV